MWSMVDHCRCWAMLRQARRRQTRGAALSVGVGGQGFGLLCTGCVLVCAAVVWAMSQAAVVHGGRFLVLLGIRLAGVLWSFMEVGGKCTADLWVLAIWGFLCVHHIPNLIRD
ncbi:hypothetical protein Dimus_001330 [Dionaea muscipula]